MAVETFHDSIHDSQHDVLCSELNEFLKSLIRVKSECISAITTLTNVGTVLSRPER